MFKKLALFVSVLVALVAIIVLSACGTKPVSMETPVVNTSTATMMPANTNTVTPTATVTPWPTPEYDIQNSYGDYYDCDPDPKTGECVCVTYHFTITMTRQNCGNYLCPTKIEFTSEYGDGQTMWIDYFDVQTSISVHNGDVVDLPSLDSVSWDIGPRAFFEATPTPQP